MSKDRKTGATGMDDQTLSECVRNSLGAYFEALDGHDTTDLYQMVLREVERPMFEAVLEYTNQNQSAAAQYYVMKAADIIDTAVNIFDYFFMPGQT